MRWVTTFNAQCPIRTDWTTWVTRAQEVINYTRIISGMQERAIRFLRWKVCVMVQSDCSLMPVFRTEKPCTVRNKGSLSMDDHFKRNLSKWEDKAPSLQSDVGPGAFDIPGSISYFHITESGIGVYVKKFLPLKFTRTHFFLVLKSPFPKRYATACSASQRQTLGEKHVCT